MKLHNPFSVPSYMQIIILLFLPLLVVLAVNFNVFAIKVFKSKFLRRAPSHAIIDTILVLNVAILIPGPGYVWLTQVFGTFITENDIFLCTSLSWTHNLLSMLIAWTLVLWGMERVISLAKWKFLGVLWKKNCCQVSVYLLVMTLALALTIGELLMTRPFHDRRDWGHVVCLPWLNDRVAIGQPSMNWFLGLLFYLLPCLSLLCLLAALTVVLSWMSLQMKQATRSMTHYQAALFKVTVTKDFRFVSGLAWNSIVFFLTCAPVGVFILYHQLTSFQNARWYEGMRIDWGGVRVPESNVSDYRHQLHYQNPALKTLVNITLDYGHDTNRPKNSSTPFLKIELRTGSGNREDNRPRLILNSNTPVRIETDKNKNREEEKARNTSRADGDSYGDGDGGVTWEGKLHAKETDGGGGERRPSVGNGGMGECTRTLEVSLWLLYYTFTVFFVPALLISEPMFRNEWKAKCRVVTFDLNALCCHRKKTTSKVRDNQKDPERALSSEKKSPSSKKRRDKSPASVAVDNKRQCFINRGNFLEDVKPTKDTQTLTSGKAATAGLEQLGPSKVKRKKKLQRSKSLPTNYDQGGPRRITIRLTEDGVVKNL